MTKFLAVVVSVILIISSYTAQAASKSTSINLEPQVAVGAYMGLVEDHLAGVLRTVSVVAQTSEAKSAKWETVKPLLDRISKDLPTGPTVWLALPDGSYYTVESGGLTDQTLMSRPYFSRLLGGQDVLGDLVISAVAKALSDSVRPMDLAARIGGEEFALLLPNCPCDRCWKLSTQHTLQ